MTEEAEIAPLGIIFDIDGTLIRESRHSCGIHLRPHAIELLAWCCQRGHKPALWTSGHWTWADRVAQKICPLVQQKLHGDGEIKHTCTGRSCRKTFEFAWGGDEMRKVKKRAKSNNGDEYDEETRPDLCKWCEYYEDDCFDCQCAAGPDECSCRLVKDIRKIWWKPLPSLETTTQNAFTPERTLIVENRPQNCRYTYGSAIYVPTFRGNPKDNVFSMFQRYIERELEGSAVDVRRVPKCDHPKGPHACYHQNWLTTDNN